MNVIFNLDWQRCGKEANASLVNQIKRNYKKYKSKPKTNDNYMQRKGCWMDALRVGELVSPNSSDGIYYEISLWSWPNGGR